MGRATPAHAEWLKASTRHFVLYADTSDADLRRQATRLERFDAALRRMHKLDDPNELTANPVTVYVADSIGAIQKLCRCSNVAGFYVPRADGAVAFTPRTAGGDGIGALKPQIVLFHEYAHHFLLGQFDAAYPGWYSEGYAELVSTASMGEEEVMIGVAANHRAWGLLENPKLSITNLLAPTRALGEIEREQVYGRGWLLTHYLQFDRARAGQFSRYLRAINTGTKPLDAATAAFGDLRQLDRDLDRYLRASRIPGLAIKVAELPAVTVAIRRLTPGERALIDMRIISTRGVDQKLATTLYARASKAAAAHPADAVAQGWLAEMAFDAGRDADAEAAADRALAADPKSVQALLYKARVQLRRAVTAKSGDAKVWKDARSWIVKANRIDPNGAAALQLFYDSFEMADAAPAASAVAGVHRALELVPQDPALRFRSARQHLLDGKVDEAKRALRPLAFNPHAPADNPAAKLLALVEAGTAGRAALDAIMPKEDATTSGE